MGDRKRPELRYETKAESKARQEQEFLALAPHERLQVFLSGFDEDPFFPRRTAPDRHAGNWVLERLRP